MIDKPAEVLHFISGQFPAFELLGYIGEQQCYDRHGRGVRASFRTGDGRIGILVKHSKTHTGVHYFDEP